MWYDFTVEVYFISQAYSFVYRGTRLLQVYIAIGVVHKVRIGDFLTRPEGISFGIANTIVSREKQIVTTGILLVERGNTICYDKNIVLY